MFSFKVAPSIDGDPSAAQSDGLKARSSGQCSRNQSRWSRQGGRCPLDEGPEPPRMVRDAEVAELMHDHVVEHLGWGKAPLSPVIPAYFRGASALGRTDT